MAAALRKIRPTLDRVAREVREVPQANAEETVSNATLVLAAVEVRVKTVAMPCHLRRSVEMVETVCRPTSQQSARRRTTEVAAVEEMKTA